MDPSTLCYSGSLLCTTDTGCDGVLFPGDLTECDDSMSLVGSALALLVDISRDKHVNGICERQRHRLVQSDQRLCHSLPR